jgi:hypothetical protein
MACRQPHSTLIVPRSPSIVHRQQRPQLETDAESPRFDLANPQSTICNLKCLGWSLAANGRGAP